MMFVIQLASEPSPFQANEALPCFVGDGARVQHIALARVFRTRRAAERCARLFPTSDLLDVRTLIVEGLMPMRLMTLGIMACPTYDDFEAYLALSEGERALRWQTWLRLIRHPDPRCPKNGATVGDLIRDSSEAGSVAGI